MSTAFEATRRSGASPRRDTLTRAETEQHGHGQRGRRTPRDTRHPARVRASRQWSTPQGDEENSKDESDSNSPGNESVAPSRPAPWSAAGLSLRRPTSSLCPQRHHDPVTAGPNCSQRVPPPRDPSPPSVRVQSPGLWLVTHVRVFFVGSAPHQCPSECWVQSRENRWALGLL